MNQPQTRICSGLPAEYVNGWLAAVGVTVLVPDLRLSWTTDPAPVAVLTATSGDPVDLLISRWPTDGRIARLPLANNHPDYPPLAPTADAETFGRRLSDARTHADVWTLTAARTDLAEDRKGRAANGPFNVGAPGRDTLHDRLRKVHTTVDPDRDIPAALDGAGRRVKANGLGFDITRLEGSSRYVNPVTETLAFFGLSLFPVRGDGIRGYRARQRGWRIGNHTGFVWPAWTQPLDQHSIDALLDMWYATWRYRKRPGRNTRQWTPYKKAWARLGIHNAWETIDCLYPPGSSNRGYASRRLP